MPELNKGGEQTLRVGEGLTQKCVFRAIYGVFWAVAGFIEEPRRVLDPMRGDLCVPRDP